MKKSLTILTTAALLVGITVSAPIYGANPQLNNKYSGVSAGDGGYEKNLILVEETETLSENSPYPQAMSTEELLEFLETAEPIPNDVSLSEDALSFKNMTKEELLAICETAEPIPMPNCTTIDEEEVTERTGSYVYDVESKTATFQPFTPNETNETEKSSPGYFPNPNANIGRNTRGIIGADNRIRVTDTTVGPWCNSVKLVMRKNTDYYIGSGFMIGPNSVATSGHCLYDGSWITEVAVIPALNGVSQPYDSYVSTSFEIGGEWAASLASSDDWGIIRLGSNIGSTTGWLGLRWQSASYNGETLTAIGYPGENQNYMYYGSGTVTSSSARTIAGNWDLSGGQSGGAVEKYYTATGYTAVGINRGGSSTYSDCLRIDSWIFDKLVSYRTKYA